MTRTQLIQSLIDTYDLKNYLEIGVFKGANFNQIRCENKYSVDPNHPATYQITSDEFFNKHAEGRYDLVFIDGMHTVEQAYKDMNNALIFLDVNGFIVVHDCNPGIEWATRPPEEYKQGEIWNGTTYLGFIQFKAEHPGLSCFTVDTDFGCGVVTRRSLLENEPLINWEFFDKNREELLQLISVDEFNELI